MPLVGTAGVLAAVAATAAARSPGRSTMRAARRRSYLGTPVCHRRSSPRDDAARVYTGHPEYMYAQARAHTDIYTHARARARVDTHTRVKEEQIDG